MYQTLLALETSHGVTSHFSNLKITLFVYTESHIATEVSFANLYNGKHFVNLGYDSNKRRYACFGIRHVGNKSTQDLLNFLADIKSKAPLDQ